jgi:hypothetical protein
MSRIDRITIISSSTGTVAEFPAGLRLDSDLKNFGLEKGN